jgi:hypothetical protein
VIFKILDFYFLYSYDIENMATVQPIDFVLSALDDEITLDVSGSLLAQAVSVLEASACAVFDLSRSLVRNIFKFQTDASDVNPDSEGDDIKYSIDVASWPNTNIAHASLYSGDLTGITQSTVSITAGQPNQLATGEIGGGFSRDRSMVKHDFVRYLAQKLFNTYLGTDLFNNEQELKDEIVRLGGTVLDNIKADLTTAHNMTNANTTSDNIGREIMKQIGAADPDRFNTDVSHGIIETADFQSIPFADGDCLIFNVKINPAAGQEVLTEAPAFGGRTYRIVLHITDTPSNQEPDDITLAGEEAVIDFFPGTAGDGVASVV